MPRPFLYSIAIALVLVLFISACGGGGGGSGNAAIPDLQASEFVVEPGFGTPADGATPVDVRLRLINASGQPIEGARVDLLVDGYANVVAGFAPTDVDGRTAGTLVSSAGERKTVRALVDSGGRVTELDPRSVDFLAIPDNTFFVRASGSDADTGRSPRAAWRTLAHALAEVGPGATIQVGAGIHTGPVTVSADSSGGRPLVISGDPAGRMAGDPGEVVIEANTEPHALALDGARNVVVQRLTLRGAVAGLAVTGSSDVRVVDCRMHENDVGIHVDGAEDLVVQDSRVSGNLADGLRLRNAVRPRIENDLFYANAGSGVVLLPGVVDASIRFNTFYRNGADQLREAEPGGNGVVEENVLAEGAAGSLELLPGSGYATRKNLVWGDATPPLGAIEADPMFADSFGPDGVLGGFGCADDDFRVLTTSPALDAGDLLARDFVLGSRVSLATRTTRVDDLCEWSGADRAETNLGWHAPIPEAPFASLRADGARLAYAAPGDVRARGGSWRRSEPSSFAPSTGPVLETDVVFLEQRVSPLDRPDEILAAQVDTGTRGRIVVRHWDGRRWTEPLLAPFLDDVPAGELADRRFDVEYESRSGRALLVVADGDGIPSFQILERGTWSVPEPIALGTPGAGSVRWVELVPCPTSNEMALVTLDDQNDLVCSIWTGAAWCEPKLLESDTVYTPGWRPFDAAFEGVSSDLLIAWGFNVFIEETRWATLERATEAWRFGQHPSSDAVGAQVLLSADPKSDRIATLMGEGDLDNDTIVSVWTGDEWVHTAELTLAGPIASRLLELEWIGESGIACGIFRREGHTGSFNFALFLQHGWRIQPDVVLPGVGKAKKVRLHSMRDSDQLVGMLVDQAGKLFVLRYDGVGWEVLNGGEPLLDGLDPDAPGWPFDAAVRRAIEPPAPLQ